MFIHTFHAPIASPLYNGKLLCQQDKPESDFFSQCCNICTKGPPYPIRPLFFFPLTARTHAHTHARTHALLRGYQNILLFRSPLSSQPTTPSPPLLSLAPMNTKLTLSSLFYKGGKRMGRFSCLPLAVPQLVLKKKDASFFF